MRLTTVLIRTLVVALSSAALSSSLYAAGVNSDEFVVLRLGDGSAALPGSNTASTKAYLDVYKLNTGAPVQSIQLDGPNFSYTNGSNRDGIFQLSQDGQSYSIGGYNAPAGTATPLASSGRTIAQVSLATGAANYSTQFAGNGSPIRAVGSKDGSQFWFATDGGGAVSYVPFGSSTVTSVSSDSSRAVNVAFKQLYTMSGSSGFRGIGAISGGLPTSGPTTTTYFTPSPNPASGPGVSSLFFADANTIYAAGSANLTVGGSAVDDFREYHFEGGSWVLKASIASPDGAASAYGIFSLPDPSIPGNFLVYMSTFSNIYKVSDNPNDATFGSGSLGSPFIAVG